MDAASGDVDGGAVEDGIDAVASGGHRRTGSPRVRGRTIDVDPRVHTVGGRACSGARLTAHHIELSVQIDGGAHATSRLWQRGDRRARIEARDPAVRAGIVDLDGVEAVGDD